MRDFFAHSTSDTSKSDWQSLPDHLKGVGALARQFADAFGAGALAEVQGWLHDLGKYTQPYQLRLQGSSLRVDHSTWGARMAARHYPGIGHLLAYGIAGHHAGLANGDGEGERTALRQRLDVGYELPALDAAWEADIALPPQLAMPDLKIHSRERKNFQLAFATRMLFSCLVDADFLDTERFYLKTEGGTDHRSGGEPAPSLEALRSQLDQYLAGLPTHGDVNPIRSGILRHVRGQADLAPGLFSLTVPTGGPASRPSQARGLKRRRLVHADARRGPRPLRTHGLSRGHE